MSLKSSVYALCPPFLRPGLDMVESSPVLYRLAKGTFWSLAGLAAARLCGLAASVVAARVLGAAGYGEFGVIQGTVGMFAVFAGFGLGLTASKHMAEFRRSDPGRAGRLIGLCFLVSAATGTLMAALLFLGAGQMAAYLNAPRLAPQLAASSAVLVFGAWSGVQLGALSGLEAFRRVYHVNLYSGLLNLPLTAAGVLLGGLSGAVAAMVLVNLASCLIGAAALRSELRADGIRVSYSGFREEWRVLWNFSLPSLLSGLLVSPVTWACSAMLAHQPGGYSELGVFNAANQWRFMALSVPGVIMQAALPIMAGAAKAELRGQVAQNIRINLAVGLAVFAGLSVMSPVIMSVYGAEFGGRWPVFVAAQGVTLLQALQAPVVAYWAASGEMWGNFRANLLWAAAVLAFSRLLLDAGAMGLMLGLLGGFLVFCLPLGLRLRALAAEGR